MTPLEEKLQRELKSSCDVIACRFPFPTWHACETVGTDIDTVWLYNMESVKMQQQQQSTDQLQQESCAKDSNLNA